MAIHCSPQVLTEKYLLISMKAPEHTPAEVFPRYSGGEVLADSAMLKWPGLFARRYRFPRVVDGFLVPATAEPLITCTLNGSAEFQERDIGGAWLPRQVRRGDIFVTGSKTPYESLPSHTFWRFTSPRNTRTSHRRGVTCAAACRSHGSARSRIMCVRTSQKASQSRLWLSWRS